MNKENFKGIAERMEKSSGKTISLMEAYASTKKLGNKETFEEFKKRVESIEIENEPNEESSQ